MLNYFSSLVYGITYVEEGEKIFTYEYVEKAEVGDIYHNCRLLTDWGLYKTGEFNEQILISNKN
jgi:hypothetical protein